MYLHLMHWRVTVLLQGGLAVAVGTAAAAAAAADDDDDQNSHGGANVKTESMKAFQERTLSKVQVAALMVFGALLGITVSILENRCLRLASNVCEVQQDAVHYI
jgi:hypothetical protein